ncbi:hypothetical protein [Nocardiopsis sp. LOL_012]|uniref:hypothetical protein n=1 Tax=Nocardiopsis sp. LOL_012 TaxID=3345409 RepID=UPI003A842FE4
MTRIFNAETVGEFTALRGNLATAYLSLVDVLRTLETQQEAATATRRQRLRAELASVDVVPPVNEADFLW